MQIPSAIRPARRGGPVGLSRNDDSGARFLVRLRKRFHTLEVEIFPVKLHLFLRPHPLDDFDGFHEFRYGVLSCMIPAARRSQGL